MLSALASRFAFRFVVIYAPAICLLQITAERAETAFKREKCGARSKRKRKITCICAAQAAGNRSVRLLTRSISQRESLFWRRCEMSDNGRLDNAKNNVGMNHCRSVETHNSRLAKYFVFSDSLFLRESAEQKAEQRQARDAYSDVYQRNAQRLMLIAACMRCICVCN